MKLLVIMYAGASPEHVREALAAHGAGAYTELDGARGAGQSGRVEGTRAWPGTASVFLTAVPPERASALENALKDCAGRCEPGERLHVATLPLERFF
jgi:hypothetical protein